MISTVKSNKNIDTIAKNLDTIPDKTIASVCNKPPYKTII